MGGEYKWPEYNKTQDKSDFVAGYTAETYLPDVVPSDYRCMAHSLAD